MMEVSQFEASNLVKNLAKKFPELFENEKSAKVLQFTKYILSDRAAFDEIQYASETASHAELKVWLAEFV